MSEPDLASEIERARGIVTLLETMQAKGELSADERLFLSLARTVVRLADLAPAASVVADTTAPGHQIVIVGDPFALDSPRRRAARLNKEPK